MIRLYPVSRLITNNALIALELFHTMKKRSMGKKGAISLKIDMRKSCDRVEWYFMERLLCKMGFAENLIQVLMRFVFYGVLFLHY